MSSEKEQIDATLKLIEDSCNNFISENFDNILEEFELNKMTINSNFSEFKIENINKNSWGVYAFYINPKETIETYEDLNRLWKTNKKEDILLSPRTIKTRFKLLNQGELSCLYVGKSQNLSHRISQHIHQKTKKTTYGLKISEHDRLHENNDFTYSYFILKENPTEYKESLNAILITLEKRLREKLQPLIGKQ